MIRTVLAFLLVIAAASAAAQPAEPAPDSGEAVEIRIVTQNGAQMDVYFDGRRVGLTPIKLQTPPVELVVSAGAPGLSPIVHEMTVTGGEDQTVTLVDRPLTRELYPVMFGKLVEAQRRHPDNVHLLVLAASVTQDPTDSADLLRGVPPEMHEEPMVLYAAARASLLMGRADRAAEMLDAAAESEPRMGGLVRVRSQIALDAGEVEKALDLANRAVLLEARNPDNFTARAEVQRRAGNLQAAEMDVLQALDLRPEDPKATQLAAQLRAARAPATGIVEDSP